MRDLIVRLSIILLACCAVENRTAAALPMDRELEIGAADNCRTDVTLPPPNSRPLPDTLKVVPPATGAYVGHFAVPAEPETLDAFAAQLGRRPPLVYTGHDWVHPLDDWWTVYPTDDLWTFDDVLEGEANITALELARRLSRQGTVLSFAWATYCCDLSSTLLYLGLRQPNGIFGRVAAGEFDDYIRQEARRIKTFDGPIMLTLVPEVNVQATLAFGPDGRDWMSSVDDLCGQYGDPAWPDGPERIRDAHRRVVDLFREEGVRNVTWFMYAGSSYMEPTNEDQSAWLHPRYFYPGDEYVDWVGQSVYFIDPAWGKSIESFGVPEVDFVSALGAGYAAWTSVTDKPIFLPEFGVVAEPGDSRARVIGEVFSQTLQQFPRVKALTFAESAMFSAAYSLPQFGALADEAQALRGSVYDNPYYVDRVLTTRTPN